MAIAFRKYNYERFPIVLRNAISDRLVYLFLKKNSLYLRMCIFCCTFVAKLRIMRAYMRFEGINIPNEK